MFHKNRVSYQRIYLAALKAARRARDSKRAYDKKQKESSND